MIAVLFFLFEGFYGRKLDWRLVASSLGGVASAFVATLFFAPGLFYYIKDMSLPVFYETTLLKNVNLPEGGEVYGMNILDFIHSESVISFLLIIAVFFEIYAYIARKKGDEQMALLLGGDISLAPLRGTFFFLSVSFFVATTLSKRFIDFFLFFSIIYLVLVSNALLGIVEIKYAQAQLLLRRATFVIVLYLLTMNSLSFYDVMGSAIPYAPHKAVGEWLRENVPPKQVIFNAEWGWFPTLYHYDPEAYYVTGLDPRFLYDYSPEVFWLWQSIVTKGYACSVEECPDMDTEKKMALRHNDSTQKWYEKNGTIVARVFTEVFHSHYVVTSKSKEELNNTLDHSDHFEKIYTDPYAQTFMVYRVK